jgi:hypothetical protein
MIALIECLVERAAATCIEGRRSFCSVFCSRFLDRLPLHVARRIRTAVLQGLVVIDDVSGARA